MKDVVAFLGALLVIASGPLFYYMGLWIGFSVVVAGSVLFVVGDRGRIIRVLLEISEDMGYSRVVVRKRRRD